MLKKKRLLLLVFFCVVFISLNALTEEEKQEIFERGKKEFLAILDSIIANNKPIESELESDYSSIKAFNGDTRQILIFYKYMLYGDKITQKKGIDGMMRWFGNPKRAEKYGQDSVYINYRPIIIKLIYEFLDDEYPILQVTAARTLIYIGISDSLVIDKLEYYTDINNRDYWINKININLYNLPDLSTYISVFGKTSKDRKRDAIEALMRMAKLGLKLINNKEKNVTPRNNATEKEYNLNYNGRDLDWNGTSSANYCYQWYGGPDSLNPIWNPNYSSYPGNDCANFASQCLIAGYYEDITYSPDADTCGCIPYCPNLHNYLSSRFDVDDIVFDFHTNEWEIGDEPNNHIPANFSVGDIVILGKQIYGADSLYQHAIICCKFDSGTHYFGAHSNNRIDKDMAWFIGPNINNLDYATFYHITNDWNCNTPIAGGAVNGT